jgi:hypothetical protein
MRRVQQLTAAPQTWADLPERIRGLLEQEGIRTPVEWRAAGRRRLRIFGVTRSTAAQLDAVVAAMQVRTS